MKLEKNLYVILASFVALSIAWNILIPPYENLDEIEHSEVIRHIAVTGTLPVHKDAESYGYRVRQEASQPPLYHLLGAIWVKVLNLPTKAPEIRSMSSNVVACGETGTFYNKATWIHNPYEDTFPWDGNIRTLHWLRLFSTLLQTFTILGTWKLSRKLFPDGPIPILTTIIVAFNPQFMFVAAGVNNDNLITPLATWGLILLIDIWQQGPTLQRLFAYGILSGLATMSKLSGAALIGIAGIVLIIYALKNQTPLIRIVSWVIFIGIPALAIAMPWLLRNINLYRDPTALTPMLEHVGLREKSADLWGTFRLMYLSYWGQVPCSFYPRSIYWPFLLLSCGGILSTLVNWKQLSSIQQEGLLILLVWFLVIIAAWIRWNAITPATGGRLLFPASPALAILIASGWSFVRSSTKQILNGTQLWAAFLPIWCLITLRAGLISIFAPPSLLELENSIPGNIEYTFGDCIQLHGYKAEIVRPKLDCWLASKSYCQPTLDITLYWKTKQPIIENWTIALQLVSSIPNENTLRLNYNHWPGHGNLPTTSWPINQLIADHYLLPLPKANLSTQAWDLQIIFFDPETKKRLPVYVDNLPIGNIAKITQMRIDGTQPILCTSQKNFSNPVYFDQSIALTHAAVRENGTKLEITLCWESIKTITDDYTVFAHAYAANGTLLATGDSPPMNQGFPTSLWEPGDKIADTHTIVVADSKEISRITVGLYHPQTGERLLTMKNGERIPNDAVVIWEKENSQNND